MLGFIKLSSGAKLKSPHRDRFREGDAFALINLKIIEIISSQPSPIGGLKNAVKVKP
jgi:hypothetical protein